MEKKILGPVIKNTALTFQLFLFLQSYASNFWSFGQAFTWSLSDTAGLLNSHAQNSFQEGNGGRV